MELAQAAREQLAARLQGLRVSEADDVCFRLAKSVRGKPTLTVCRSLPGDVTFKHGNSVVFAVAPDIAPQFAGQTLDLRENEGGETMLVAYATST
jgi:hypothetical protein